MTVRRISQRLAVGVATGYLPWRPGYSAIGGSVKPPPELRERRETHELSDPDRVFNARSRAACKQVPGEGGHFRAGIRHGPPPANARRNHRCCLLASGVEDFAGGGWTLPAAILIVGRVESERVHEPLRQRIQPACLASKRLGDLGLELPFRRRLSLPHSECAPFRRRSGDCAHPRRRQAGGVPEA